MHGSLEKAASVLLHLINAHTRVNAKASFSQMWSQAAAVYVLMQVMEGSESSDGVLTKPVSE